MQTWNQSNQVAGDGRAQTLAQIIQSETPTLYMQRVELLPFLRKIEKLVCEQPTFQQQCAAVYWSSSDASWMIPARAVQLALTQATLACPIFSEHRQNQNEEFFFALVSKELSVIVYGTSTDAGQGPNAAGPTYQCTVSFNSQQVRRACQTMSFYWEFIDPMEADKLDGSIRRLGDGKTSAHFISSLGIEWDTLKAPPPAPVESKPKKKSSTSSEVTAEKGSASVAPKVDDWQQRMAHDYPYPIANPYRTLECITNASEIYKEQLRLIENLLALLAGISMAISAQNEPGVLTDNIKDWFAMGVSVGHWRELIRRCTVSWKSSSTKDIPLAKAISELRVEQTEKAFGKAVEQLIRARNDFAHHRGPTAESQLEKEAVRLGEILKEAIKYTEFLCDHPFRIVKAIDVLPSSAIKMICLKATGDHPALRQEELCLSRGFPKGHLIAHTGNNNWISLYPFLTQDICPKCGVMEIYHLDKWRFDKNQMHLRSFERGHTQESKEISDTLKSLINSKNP